MSTTIQNDLVAAIHYTLKNDDGEIVDSSEGRDPLEYLHGHGNLVVGLERVLAGKAPGDSLKISVAPEDGYGITDEDLVIDVPREHLPEDIETGMRFSAETSSGMRLFTIVEIEDDTVIMDGNHPLAGETLHFEVEVVSIREPEPAELAHGHVHSGGHHHHDDDDEDGDAAGEGGGHCGSGCGCH